MATCTLQIMVGGRIPVEIGLVPEVELEELLGTGGFGSAWKVADRATGRAYVLKVIQGLAPGSVEAERVRREAEVHIPSEYVVPVVGLREWGPGTFLILFEYFAARSLEEVLASGGLGDDRKKRIFEQTLLGVADAHRHNVVHRDLKPANILVGEDDRVKLIDFGISKFKGPGLTATGEIVGTLQYMAPELLLHGAKVADARADVYSLGHVWYELAMGQHFWARQGWRELRDLVSYLTRTPPPTEGIDLDDFHCDFHPEARSILGRMVKIDPDERYRSVEEVLADLGYAIERPSTPADLHLRSPLLIVESGTNRGARTVLGLADGERRALGRGEIAGSDLSISRCHLEFHREGDRYFVRDLGSKNGTLVAGLALGPADGAVEVRHADRVKVGDVFLRFAFLREG